MPVTIPPFTNVPAPNDPVKSDWAQQLTQSTVDQYVAQPGTPTSPYAEIWYDDDDAGASFPNMPRGYVTHAQLANTQVINAVTTWTDITGVSVSWVADPTRRYRVNLFMFGAKPSPAGGVYVRIADSANNQLEQAGHLVAADGIWSVALSEIVSGLSGTVTRKAQVYVTAAPLHVYGPQNASNCRITVEDIGASGQSGGGVWSDAFPRGWVGHATTSGDSNHTSASDVPGLSVTWIADPTRRYRTTCAIEIQGSVTPASMIVSLVTGALALVNRKAVSVPYANALNNLTIDAIESGLSGTQTRKIQVQNSAGTATVIGGNSYGPYLIVEDIGRV